MRRAWVAAAALIGPWLLARPARFGAPGEPGPTTTVSVIIPARDEEASLPSLLASLAAGSRRPEEVIVVDDASGDRTGELARAAGAEVLTSSGPPPGWSGKCWALDQGQRAATGDLLVFLDADVTVAPDGLARIVAEHQRLGGTGIVSAEPWHAAQRPVEALSAVANVAVLMATGAFAPRWWGGRNPRPMAFGPCLAVDRVTYDAAGGHGAHGVRARICEDLYLARLVAATGAPVALFSGVGTVAMRMYPLGARQAFDGWTKVLATGASAGSPVLGATVAVWVTAGLLASRAGVTAAVDMARGRRPRPSDVATYAAWAAQMAWLQRRAGSFGAAAALGFPFPMSFFAAAALRSAVLIGLGRPLAWRGRRLTGRA